MPDTEVTYVQKLGGVTTIILEPLEWNAQISPDPLLPKLMIEQIFSNIKQLTQLNKTLLHDLELRVKKNEREGKLGDLFLRFGEHVAEYSTYYQQHDMAIQKLDLCMNKYPNFVDFLEKCKDHPDFVNMRLETLLIEPVQRIPRYIMYLEDIKKVGFFLSFSFFSSFFPRRILLRSILITMTCVMLSSPLVVLLRTLIKR